MGKEVSGTRYRTRGGGGGVKGPLTVRTGRLRMELIAKHFVRQIKEAGPGYGPGAVGEATTMPAQPAVSKLPATWVTHDDQ
jgi:hypothetical protein